MRRRDFLGVLGSAAAYPLAAHSQSAMPVVGFLHAGLKAASAEQADAFLKGLGEAGAAVGRDVVIEYRWAEGQYDRLPALAAELLSRRVAVLMAGGGPVAINAAKAATATTPIVFVSGDDPVKHGLVASINRPGGNITGAFFFSVALVGKRLELIREIVPAAASFGYLGDPHNPETENEAADLQTAARSVGREVSVILGSDDRELESAYAEFARRRTGAVIVASDPRLFGRAGKLTALAVQYRIPTIYTAREYVRAGGLISYGNHIPDAYREAGVYAGRILKGAKPADLPIVQSSKFDLAINLKTAKALGIDVPLLLQQRADEVIE